MQTIYNYHPDSRIFVGVADADPDPLTPGGFLMPAHSSLIAPPVAPEGQVAVFDTELEAWALVDTARFKSADEPVMSEEEASALAITRARTLRNSMLAASDTVVLRCYEAGEPVPLAWVAYRKTLRALPSQEGFPNLEFPAPPAPPAFA